MKKKENITLEEALSRIDILEKENAQLKETIKDLESRSLAGRKKHDAKWTAKYDLFVELYENGNTIPMIVEKTDFSKRTIYRYKEYYDSIKKVNESK